MSKLKNEAFIMIASNTSIVESQALQRGDNVQIAKEKSKKTP